MATGATKKMKKRLNLIVIVAVVLAFTVVTGSLFNISVLQYSFYTNKANSQQLKPQKIAANRGTIYDRNGEILAQSATVWDVVISPKDISGDENREVIAEGLAKILDLDKEKILKQTKKDNQYEVIKRKVEKEQKEEILQFISNTNKQIKEDNKKVAAGEKKRKTISGIISLTETTKRYYPNGELASSVIGFTRTDSPGIAGIELEYDSILAGTPGYVVSLTNGLSQNMADASEERYNAIDGNSLRLTLDQNIQSITEKVLDNVMAQYNPERGCCAIVMNIKNGEILAMANKPNFDLNDPYTITDQKVLDEIASLPEDEREEAQSTARQQMWGNKCVSYTFEPGSTFKTLVTSEALEEKTTSLNSHFFCPGYIVVGGEKMKCHRVGGHGDLDFTGALVGSCNPSFVKIGASLGKVNFFKYFQAYGLTERTGIDLPGEAESRYYTDKNFNEVSLASSSFGQSMTLSAIQLVTAIAAATNGGYLVQPHVVKDILDTKGNVVESINPTTKRQVISNETSKTLVDMMEKVVDGSSYKTLVKGYRIGGKTGTAQILTGNDASAMIASYVGIAPVENPEYLVYVMADIPRGSSYLGSAIAAPAASSIFAEILPYLGYQPNLSEEDLKMTTTTAPSLLGKGLLDSVGWLNKVGLIRNEVVGTGGVVTKMVPAGGTRMPKDGNVILYTGDAEARTTTMIDVVGLTPQVAKQKLQTLGLNVIIEGTTDSKYKIKKQSVAKGTTVDVASVVTISASE